MPTPPATTARTPPDAELAALGKCLRLLEGLDATQRQRVLLWLVDRHFGPDAAAAVKGAKPAGA
jgi:hypothetical protein